MRHGLGANSNNGALVCFTTAGVAEAVAQVDFMGDKDALRGLALMPDGNVVAVGQAYSDGDYNFAVARFNSDLSLDTTFKTTGKTTTSLGYGDDIAYSVTVGSDGKITAVGRSAKASVDFADGALQQRRHARYDLQHNGESYDGCRRSR